MELSPVMEQHEVEVDGAKVFYTARGPHDSRLVYIGINGLLGGGDSFWPVIAGVPDNWRIILPDLPGCGESSNLRPPYKHDVSGYTRWLEHLIERLELQDRKVVLASIATGAPISVRYARKHPGTVIGQVLHLPFLGKLAIAAKWARPLVAYGLGVRPLRKVVDRLRASDALMHKIIIHKPPDAIPLLAERDIDHKQTGDLEAAGELLHDLMLVDAREELVHVKSPLLILASEHDFSAPVPLLEAIVKGRKERKLYVYKGGQHSWNEEFIDDMNREIRDFLTQVEDGALSEVSLTSSGPTLGAR